MSPLQRTSFRDVREAENLQTTGSPTSIASINSLRPRYDSAISTSRRDHPIAQFSSDRSTIQRLDSHPRLFIKHASTT